VRAVLKALRFRASGKRSAEYYRGEAERCLKMSASARDPAVRTELREVASICDELAELLEELEKSAQRLDRFPR
jgi:hypothetical protein